MDQADTISSFNMELDTDFELLYLFACLHLSKILTLNLKVKLTLSENNTKLPSICR